MKKLFKTAFMLTLVAGLAACSSPRGGGGGGRDRDDDDDKDSKENVADANSGDDFNFTLPLTVEVEAGELSKYVTFDPQLNFVVSTENGDTTFTVTSAASIAMTVNEPFASSSDLTFNAEFLDENHILIAEEPNFVTFDAPYDWGTGYTFQPGTVRAQFKREIPFRASEKEDFVDVAKKIKTAKYILLKPTGYSLPTYTPLGGSQQGYADTVTVDTVAYGWEDEDWGYADTTEIYW